MYTTNQTIRQAMRNLLADSLSDLRDQKEVTTTIFRQTRAANDGGRVLSFVKRTSL